MRHLFVIISCIVAISVTAQQKPKSTIYFAYDSSGLTAAARNEIYLLVKDMKDHVPAVIIINGYTDKSGPADYNEKLSLSRAESVLAELKKQLPAGININLKGFGSYELVSLEDEKQNLNRRVEIYFEYATGKDTVVEVEGYKEDVAEQHFKINLDDTARIKAMEGTMIKIAPRTIQNRQGKLVHGNAEVLIREYYDPAKILLAGLHSSSDSGLLQTGGMLNIIIIKDGDTMSSKTLKHIEIRIPVKNPELDDMKVFSLPGNHDAPQWKNTGAGFSQLASYWDRPYSKVIEDVNIGNNKELTEMVIGKKIEQEYGTFNSIFPWAIDRHYAKTVKMNMYKPNSDSINVNAKIKFRARGRRMFGKKILDTTFTVHFMKAFYDGLTDNLNWINCDRFYKYKNKIDFYVNTPAFDGMNVMAYFKDIHAFMPAYFSGNKYVIKNVPAGMNVTLVAIGKKGEDYYFGKKDVAIKSEVFSFVNIEKLNKESLKKFMNNL